MRPYYTMHTDSGHGWLAVPADDVLEIGLSAQSFSWYSYKKDNLAGGLWFYLEEDCDASKFINTYVECFGFMPAIKSQYVNGNSPIRRYARVGTKR